MSRCAVRTKLSLVVLLPAIAQASPPVFHASEILRPEAIRGSDYVVEDRVPLEDGRYHFTLRTPYGPITAEGLDMLNIRIDEMRAIARAEKMKREAPELEGVKDQIKKTGKGLEALITDPLDALGSIPRGIGRKAKTLTHKSTYTKGGSDTRRKLAAAIGADPETRNSVLEKLLDEISLRRSLGQGITGAATLGLTGGAALAAQGASALRTTAEMQETLRGTPLYKIKERIERDLERMGLSKVAAEEFAEHKPFTTLQRLQFVAQLERLAGVGERQRLAHHALNTNSEAEALDLIHSVQLLADVSDRVPTLNIAQAELPAARLKDGRLVVVSAADYLLDVEPLLNRLPRASVQRPETQMEPPVQDSAHSAGTPDQIAGTPTDTSPPVLFLTAGRVAPQVAEQLRSAGITVIEKGQVDQLK